VSHCITLFTKVTVEEYKLPGDLADVRAVKVDGTPADCVKVALTAVYADWRPDVVVSGINYGLNTARSVIYSGTVAAAMEATLNDVPSVAISIDFPTSSDAPDNERGMQWESAAFYCSMVVDTVLETGVPPGSFLNVNVPNLPRDQIKGVRLTRQGVSTYNEFFKEVSSSTEAAAGKRTFVVRGTFELRDSDPAVDAVAVAQGFISVCPLGLFFHSDKYSEIVAAYSKWSLFRDGKL